MKWLAARRVGSSLCLVVGLTLTGCGAGDTSGGPAATTNMETGAMGGMESDAGAMDGMSGGMEGAPKNMMPIETGKMESDGAAAGKMEPGKM